MSLPPPSSPDVPAVSSSASLPWSSSAKATVLMQRYNELFEHVVRILVNQGYTRTQAQDEVVAAGRLHPRTTVDDFDQLEPYTDREALLGFKAHNAINRLKRHYADKLQEKRATAEPPQAFFLYLFNPLLQALKDLGGSARPVEVRDHLLRTFWLLDRARYQQLEGGTPRFNNLLSRAQFFLVKAGYLCSSHGGDWTLTEKGQAAYTLSKEEVWNIFRTVHAEFSEVNQTQDWPEMAINQSEEVLFSNGKIMVEDRGSR